MVTARYDFLGTRIALNEQPAHETFQVSILASLRRDRWAGLVPTKCVRVFCSFERPHVSTTAFGQQT